MAINNLQSPIHASIMEELEKGLNQANKTNQTKESFSKKDIRNQDYKKLEEEIMKLTEIMERGLVNNVEINSFRSKIAELGIHQEALQNILDKMRFRNREIEENKKMEEERKNSDLANQNNIFYQPDEKNSYQIAIENIKKSVQIIKKIVKKSFTSNGEEIDSEQENNANSTNKAEIFSFDDADFNDLSNNLKKVADSLSHFGVGVKFKEFIAKDEKGEDKKNIAIAISSPKSFNIDNILDIDYENLAKNFAEFGEDISNNIVQDVEEIVHSVQVFGSAPIKELTKTLSSAKENMADFFQIFDTQKESKNEENHHFQDLVKNENHQNQTSRSV